MKKILVSISLVLVIVLACIFITSCGDDTDYTQIETIGMVYENGVYKASVSPSVSEIDLSEKFTVLDNAYYLISSTESFEETLENTRVELKDGDNVYFIKVCDGKHESIYKINIYKKRTLTVEFDTNGGTAVPSVTVEEGKSIEAPNTSKLGYELSWDYDFAKPITQSMTIKAQWTPCKYQITLSAAGTELDNDTIDVSFDSKFDLPKPSRDGYEFKGWLYKGANFDGKTEYKFTENITLTADFDTIDYSITFVVEAGGTNPNAVKTFTVEDVIELQDATWKDDEKIFSGWYTNDDYSESSKISSIKNVTHNIVLYAKFSNVVFTNSVLLYVNDVLVESVSLEFTYKSPYSITYVPDVDEFHKFEGWTYNGVEVESTGAFWPYKTEIRLDAIITARTYQIEYILNDDNAENNSLNPNEFTSDESVDLLAPTCKNYVFLGWYSSIDFDESSKVETITSEYAGRSLTLYAKWQYGSLVTFDTKNDTTIENEFFVYGEAFTLPKLTRDRYAFDGWYYNGNKVSSETPWEYKEDATLIANWIPLKSTITYILNGGIQNDSNVQEYDIESGVINLFDPSWENNLKRFVGWYTDSEFTTAITEVDSAEFDGITVYAKWEEFTVEITLDPAGGQISSNTINTSVGSNYVLFEPVLEGYKFDGWYYGDNLVAINDIWNIAEDKVTLVAKWSVVTYVIDYNLNDGESNELIKEYTIVTDDFKLPIPYKDGYAFIGWKTADGAIIEEITISKGSTGNRAYEAVWYQKQDDNGFVYELREGVMVIIGYNKTIGHTETYEDLDVYIPAEHDGYKVTIIDTRAFAEFGVNFNKATYVKNKSIAYYRDGDDIKGFTKVYVSTNIQCIGAYAFEGCYGLKIQVYSPDGGDTTPRNWEQTSNVVYEAGNLPVRDCIWGFRPALGWSRYTLADIPEDY